MPSAGISDSNSMSADASSQQALSHLSNSAHLKQRRARSQLSCVPCRQGKLKCNRSHDPACDQCIKRNREDTCLYVPAPVKQKPTQNVKGRIRQLESLVVGLMNQQNTNNLEHDGDGEEPRPIRTTKETSVTTSEDGRTGPFEQLTPPSDTETSAMMSNHNSESPEDRQADVDSATKCVGQMRISRGEIRYVGETHWQAILSSISDLKRELGEETEGTEEEANICDENSKIYGNAFGNIPIAPTPLAGNDVPQTNPPTGLGFLVGNVPGISKEQLIASVPEKKIADRLLSLWFNSPDPFKPIIHAPTFQDEYRNFWKNPQKTPAMWLGLLFAILSLAASFGLRDADPSSSSAKAILTDVNKYHTLSASAAVLADFTKPKPYTIECLIIYASGLRSNDAFMNVWLMIGLVVRLSLRMGYHRDPSNYPAISTFNGEMRRRVWAITSMIDVLISFQLGLPSMVKTIQSDTQPPQNLLDRDFNVNTKVLPQSRGVDELTPSSYTRAKLRIVRIFADATEISHSTVPHCHKRTMNLDRDLEEARAAIPPLLQMPDISELVTDPAEQLMCRFNLDLLYLKTKIVLHRQYMQQPFATLMPHEQQMGLGISRRACVDCAHKVLRHHHTIYTASQAGGQLESVKWYMGSISTHDFLLAAMVICLELSQQIDPNSKVMRPNGAPCPYRDEMMDALQKSQTIWAEASRRKRKPIPFVGTAEHSTGEHMFDETERAGRAMAVMLERVKAKFPIQEGAPANSYQQDASPENATRTKTPSTSGGSHELPPDYLSRGDNGIAHPFGGVVSFHPWGNTTSVPSRSSLNQSIASNNINQEDIAITSVGSSNNSSNVTYSGLSLTSPPTASSENPSPSQDLLDFSVIGDMLNVSGNIDWEMFDAGTTTKAGTPFHFNEHSGIGALQDLSQPQMPGLGSYVAGNAINGSGGGAGTTFPGSWMMHNMDFDMGDLGSPALGDGAV